MTIHEPTWDEAIASRDRQIRRERIVLALLLVFGIPGGLLGARAYDAQVAAAERADSIVSVHAARADSIARARRSAELADSVRMAELADSVAAWRARADSLGRQAAEAARSADAARERATAAAATLEETLTTTQVPLFDAYRDERDAEASALRTQVSALTVQLGDARAENTRLWEARESMADLYARALEQIAEQDGESAALRISRDAYREALKGAEAQNRRLKIVAAAVVALSLLEKAR